MLGIDSIADRKGIIINANHSTKGNAFLNISLNFLLSRFQLLSARKIPINKPTNTTKMKFSNVFYDHHRRHVSNDCGFFRSFDIYNTDMSL